MKLGKSANQIYIIAYNEAKLQGHCYMTPEHLLAAALFFDSGKHMIAISGGDVSSILKDLQDYFNKQIPKGDIDEPDETLSFTQLLENADELALKSGRESVELKDLLSALYRQPETCAVDILNNNGVNEAILLGGELDSVPFEQATAPMHDNYINIKPFVTDMLGAARKGEYDPLIGRGDVLRRTEQVLLRRKKNNPVHVGEAGVGKTSIVEGLAMRIASGQAPAKLSACQLLSLDITAIVAGTKYRGEFEARMKMIFDTLLEMNDIILYIDEIHTVIGAGASSGSGTSAADILKPYLAGGRIRFIGSTTSEEYRKVFEKDTALLRRFQKIEVLEPTICQTVEILKGLRNRYEQYHEVSYTQEALVAAAQLTAKFMHERRLPDKAIDIIDEAGAKARMEEDEAPICITSEHIEKLVSEIAKVPQGSVSSDEARFLRNLSDDLKAEIFGQNEAIDKVTHAIKKARSGLEEREKPVASLLFVGQTGVGKTALAKTLASILHIPLIRFDMSEYQLLHAVEKLIGSPPGYVGYEEGGLLTEAIRRSPYSILLLDEVEKAHADVLNVLLQVMDYGTLTDNAGRHIDFKNVVLIMTSNLGAADLEKGVIGFKQTDGDGHVATSAVKSFFSPEFRSRLDDVIYFRPFDSEMALKIAKKSLDLLALELQKKDIVLQIDDDAFDYLGSSGKNARQILAAIENEIKSVFVDELLFNKDEGPKQATVLLRGGKIHVMIEKLVDGK